ncbi:MAG: molybdopterin-synthase adenylyltransferase MoeB, partial [Bdellovibrionota bacterium]
MNQQELLRYSRHFLLPEVGVAGQEKLKAAKVLLIGAGGLGSPMALYLAAAGVGRIGIVDFDVVDESNLQRQILYRTSEVGASKARQAARRLTELNPHIDVIAHEHKLTSANAMELFATYDIIADGADNFSTRFLVNDAAYFSRKPLVAASILGFEGQLSVFNYEGGPCYRCLYPEPPPAGTVPSCSENGVLGVLPGVMGTLQATEVVKLILSLGMSLSGHLLFYDALHAQFQKMNLKKNPECPLCGSAPTISALQPEASVACALESVVKNGVEISARELVAKLRAQEPMSLIDVREDFEVEICRIEGSR